jgi:hypothetical protein
MVKRLLKASILTERGHTWLKDSRSARILSVFNRICNLINENGEVLSVVAPEIGAGPFSLVVREFDVSNNVMGFSTWLDRSSKVRIGEERLWLGPLAIDLSDARYWDPKPDWEEIYRRRKLILRKCTKWISPLLKNAPSESLIQILRRPIALEFGVGVYPETIPGTSDRFVNAALKPIHWMVHGITEEKQSLWERGVRSLAGLGRGLTPAGDDFILGALYALRVVFPHEHAERIAFNICELATEQTSHLSAAYLRAAARGEAVELWHLLLEALISCDEKIFREAVLQFRKVGYTSGFDALAGFMYVLFQSMNPMLLSIRQYLPPHLAYNR